MGRIMIDLTGKRFGKLTALSIDHKSGRRTYWDCRCDCGNHRIVSGDHLRGSEVKDCGCQRKGVAHWVRHGGYNTRLYRIWSLMKERCYNPKRKEYNRYGARNISVCNDWHDFKLFMEWALNNGYKDNLTIDRIDNDGNYCPENCRWISRKEQSNNRRVNRYITFNGETKTITEWANDNNLHYYILRKRIDILGWDFERAISEPVHTNKSQKERM